MSDVTRFWCKSWVTPMLEVAHVNASAHDAAIASRDQRIASLEAGLRAAEAALQAAQKDAERYRFWREHHGWSGYFDDGASNSEEAADVDAAIDSARLATNESGDSTTHIQEYGK